MFVLDHLDLFVQLVVLVYNTGEVFKHLGIFVISIHLLFQVSTHFLLLLILSDSSERLLVTY